jgi:hypothetical protein
MCEPLVVEAGRDAGASCPIRRTVPIVTMCAVLRTPLSDFVTFRRTCRCSRGHDCCTRYHHAVPVGAHHLRWRAGVSPLDPLMTRDVPSQSRLSCPRHEPLIRWAMAATPVQPATGWTHELPDMLRRCGVPMADDSPGDRRTRRPQIQQNPSGRYSRGVRFGVRGATRYMRTRLPSGG